MHLQAIEVVSTEGSVQEVTADWDKALDIVHEVVGADAHWQTLSIDGREYVLIATPFC